MLVDQYGEVLARPWLTKITDIAIRAVLWVSVWVLMHQVLRWLL
jgi:hypothetical protein